MYRVVLLVCFLLSVLSMGGAADSPVGDLNGDYLVNHVDFALMAEHWLEDNRPPVMVRWYGHTSWKIWQEDVIIYIDPVGLDEALPDAALVLVSHTHSDHYSANDINRVAGPNTIFVGSTDAVSQQGWGVPLLPDEVYEMGGIHITAMPAYNLSKSNHPRANNWLGFVIELGGLRFYYAGDTDVIPEMQTLSNIDVAIVPIGGGASMSASQAAQATYDFKPTLSLPSHWGKYRGDLSDAKLFQDSAYGEVVILEEGERLNLRDHDPDMPLCAYWPLDEGEGELAYDLAGAHTGQLLGDATWTMGMIGGAVVFDGDDEIETEFVLNPAVGPFCVMAWVQGGGEDQVMLKCDSRGKAWLATNAQGCLLTELGIAGRSDSSLVSPMSITDGVWHHVVLNWDGQIRELVVDGEICAQDSDTVTMEDLEEGCMALGVSWQGLLDDIRIYGAAVPKEVLTEIASAP